MREAQVANVVVRSISGHLPEKMQQRYSTARGHEQESAIGRIYSSLADAYVASCEATHFSDRWMLGAVSIIMGRRLRRRGGPPPRIRDHWISRLRSIGL